MTDLAVLTDEVLQDFTPININSLSSCRVVNCLHPAIYNGNLCKCGKCILCRVSQRKEWSLRLDLEGVEVQFSAFATLTYAPEYVPFELDKKDLQNFMKRLRYFLSYSIRYFASGEYGDNFTHRPHFHIVIFGLKPEDYHYIEEAWSQGFVKVDILSDNRCNYVCGYVQKKLSFFYSDARIPVGFYNLSFIERASWCRENNILDLDFRARPFALMSRMPGLGTAWYERNKLDIFEKKFISLGGKRHPIPRFFRKIIDTDFPEFKEDFIQYCESKVAEDFIQYVKKYNDTNFDNFYDYQLDKIKHRAEEIKRKNELYLARKRERNNKNYGGVAI